MVRASMVAVSPRTHWRPVVGAALCLAMGGCNQRAGDGAATSTTETSAPELSQCPSSQLRETRAPDVLPDYERAEFWLAKLPPEQNNEELLDADERGYLAARVAELPGGWRDPLGPVGADPQLVERELSERLEWLRGRVSAGKYVETQAGALERAAARVQSAAAIEGPALRFIAEETPLWCVPTREGLYSDPIDLDFDRNRCSSLHPGELVRALRDTPDGNWIYVDAGHSVGWVEQGSAPTLGPALEPAAALERLGPGTDRSMDDRLRLWLTGDFEHLRAGSSFPLLSHDDERFTILVPDVGGAHERELPTSAPVETAALPFTRRALFEQAFALLEQPYGWGGLEGRRDCSRYLHDLFAQFDVRLARNSGVQAQLGTRSIDLSHYQKEEEEPKRQAIREAAAEGIVLLYMPGHIMLYLGHEGDHDYGISSLSEYLEPCTGGPDTVHRLDKVAVTTLELGRGTERRAFIERITRIAVFGPPPAP